MADRTSPPAKDDVAPAPLDRAIGVLLAAVDHLIAALDAPDERRREDHVAAARQLLRKVDRGSWRRAGKVDTFDGVV